MLACLLVLLHTLVHSSFAATSAPCNPNKVFASLINFYTGGSRRLLLCSPAGRCGLIGLSQFLWSLPCVFCRVRSVIPQSCIPSFTPQRHPTQELSLNRPFRSIPLISLLGAFVFSTLNSWPGIKLADKFGHPGYQSVHYPGGYTTEWGYGDESPYSEDCLYLNVWTKAPGKVGQKLPVALWIHGGGYREGWGSEPEFDGQEWANKDVVLVSINYRLGVFGFLTHPELSKESPNHVSGNYGILDQIESLKWIKKNIAQFGGDPDNVTIFGQSAGAGSVKTLCESPLARGLFKKAIIMIVA